MLLGKPIAIPSLEQKHLNPFPSKKKMDRMEEALNSGPYILRKRERLGEEREKTFPKETISVASGGHSEAGGASCAPAAHPLIPTMPLAAGGTGGIWAQRECLAEGSSLFSEKLFRERRL